PDQPGLRIHLLPTDAPQLVLAGARVIAANEQSLETGRQFLQQPLILVLLQEPLPDIILFQHGNRRLPLDQRRVFLRAESESAAHDGELAIDGGVARARRPGLRDVLPHLSRTGIPAGCPTPARYAPCTATPRGWHRAACGTDYPPPPARRDRRWWRAPVLCAGPRPLPRCAASAGFPRRPCR